MTELPEKQMQSYKLLKEFTPSQTVPYEVRDALSSNLEKYKEYNGFNPPEEEQILYCSPPSYKHIIPAFGLFIGMGIIFALVGITMLIIGQRLTIYLVMAGFILIGISIILYGFSQCVEDIYGYRVVTNYRAALVVPKSTGFIWSSSVRSIFFEPGFDQLKCAPTVRPGNKFLAAIRRSTTDSDVGNVKFCAPTVENTIFFTNAKQCNVLEGILENVAQGIAAQAILPPEFEVKQIETFGDQEASRFLIAFSLKWICSGVMTLVGIGGGVGLACGIGKAIITPPVIAMVGLCLCFGYSFFISGGEEEEVCTAIKEGRSTVFAKFRPSNVQLA